MTMDPKNASDQETARLYWPESRRLNPELPPWEELTAMDRAALADLGFLKFELREMFHICTNIMRRIEALEKK